ncbi:unnamed protein product [Prunus armeniaca]
MAEGSPGAPFNPHRLAKRSRASENAEPECDMDADLDSRLMQDQTPIDAEQVSRFHLGSDSFRDKLMNKVNLTKNVGIDVNCLDDDYEDLNDNEDVVISRGDRGPSIQFSDRAMDRLCRPWKNALIIKLLGRSHTYNYLRDRLHQKWSLKGEWKLIDLVNDYFVVKFELEEDLNFVLTGGPWIIAGQYLVMQKWRPGFCPATAHITRMAVWLRVSAIQLECFDVWSLKRVGNLLGKLLKIDSLTTAQNRGKFARLCVELDLTKPLDAFVQINQNWYNIEYEGLPDICYLCGRYGHKQEKCDLNTKDAETVNGETTSAMGANVEGSVLVGSNRAHYESDQSLRGPWMNVPPRRRPQSNFKGVGGKDSGVKIKGSRFDALRQVDENFGKDEGNSGELLDQTGSRPVQAVVTDLNMGNKVWTKSKGKKSVARQALEDISNKSLPVKNRVKENYQNTGVATRNTSGSRQAASVASRSAVGISDSIGMVGFQGKESVAASPLHEQFASWGGGQSVQKEKGLYIFGHQPPNIGEVATSRDENFGSDSDDEVLIPSDSEGLDPIEKMDFSEGRVSSHGGHLASNTSTSVGGMTFES